MSVKKIKKRSKFVFAALLAFTVYTVISFVDLNQSIKDRQADSSLLETKIEEQLILNQEVQQIIDQGIDSEYIIKMAREKLGFVFPNERVYVDISGR